MEASAALRAAIPLLQIAETVTLLHVDDHRVGTPCEEAAAYLSRHGVHAEVLRRTVEADGVPDVILDEAAKRKASYIVMGGFSRSRLSEAIFGGVTRSLLRMSPLPLVIMH